MTTRTIRNGATITVPVETGETLKIVAVTGTYTATIVRGTGIGTALATAATGGSYGPYAYAIVVSIAASASSEIDFDVAVTPDVASDTVPSLSFDTSGNVTGLVVPGGVNISVVGTNGLRTVLFGDSLSQYNNYSVSISTISRASNVVTVVTSSAHNMRTGQLANIVNMSDSTYQALNTAITYISSTSFSYVNTGANGSTSGGTVVGQNQFYQAGDFVWANALLGGRMRFVANMGIAAQTTTQMLARISDVFALSPQVVYFQGGTNDVNADTAYAAIIANLKSIIDAITSRNILCVIKTIPPYGGAGAYYTAARNANLQNVNQWIRRYATVKKGVVVVDAYSAIINPTDANGYGTASMYQPSDTVHYNAKGALAIGRKAYTALANLLPAVDNHVTSITDNYGFNNANLDLHDRAPWTNTGGTVNSPATGTVPTGWIVDSTAVGNWTTVPTISVASRSDGLGYNIVAAMQSNASGATYTLRTDSTAQNARIPSFVGKIYRWAAEIEVVGASGANIRNIQFYASASIGGPSGTIAAAISGSSAASQVAIDTDGVFFFMTPEFAIPSGAVTNCSATIKVEFDGVGTAVTIKVGSVRLMPMGDA